VKSIFNIGDTVSLEFKVIASDLAQFNGQMVHPFYSTFSLGRDAEWTCRQFVLQMKEEGEEGIGTFLNIQHKSPALLGEIVVINAEIIRLDGNQIDCSFQATVGSRLIAEGEQGQRILKKSKIQGIIDTLGSSQV
jgi:fluoroacetyl-CoA thioesterase